MNIKYASSIFVIASVLFAVISVCNADVRDYEGIGHYVMSDFETPDIAKQRAKARAEQAAIEQAGVYVRSYTKTLNSSVVEDEIITIAGNILKIKDTKYQIVPIVEAGGSFQITATVIATIDTDEVQKWLNRDSKDKELLIQQNLQLQKLNDEQEKKIAYLQKQLAFASSQQDRMNLQKDFKNADQEFLALEKIKSADRALMTFDYTTAISYCNEAIKLNPNSSLAYEIIGTCYYEQRQFELAIENFTKAIALDKNNSSSYNKRGASYQALSKYDSALSDLNMAISLSPKNERMYNNRAMIYSRLGKTNLAMTDYAKAIDINPNYGLAYYNRAETYLHLNEYSNAILDFTKAISLNPYDADAYNDRSIAYNASKQYSLAIADCTKSIELKPKNPNAYFNRGEAYFNQNKYDLAAKDFLNTLELNPYDAEAHEKLGMCFSKLGYTKEAQACFDAANKVRLMMRR